jgi:uncharacterized protein
MHASSMKKYMLMVLFALIILFLLGGCNNSGSYVEIDGKKITVEIADNQKERQTGLMFRENLCDGCGMLFIFEEESLYRFWMKNTLIPLDMVFIDSSMSVVDLIHAIPCTKDVCESYVPKSNALYVLEVNGNKFDDEIIGKKVVVIK